MSIKGQYNKDNANIEVSIDGEIVFSAPKSYLHSRGKIHTNTIKKACNEVFNAAPNTHFDMTWPDGKKSAVYAKLGLY